MRICKECKIEKPLDCYTHYKNYPNKFRVICKECENKKSRERGKKLKEDFEKQKKEEHNILIKFDQLQAASEILKLIKNGYDVSWSKQCENIVTFSKGSHIIHAKNATKEIYDLIFARYSLEFKK